MNENEYLAVNVMGWKKSLTKRYTNAESRFGSVIDCYISDLGEVKVIFNDWNPRNNIEQAMMLLEKFDDIHLIKDSELGVGYIWGVELTGHTCFIFNFNKSLPDAIVDAVLSAKGYKDE